MLLFVRLLFAVLLIFEFLNWFGILNFHIEFTWLGLIITAGGVWIIAESVLSRFKDDMSDNVRGLAMIGIFVMVLLDVLADVNRWYGRYPNYDTVAHFIGGAAAGILFFIIFQAFRDSAKKQFKTGRGVASFFALTSAVFMGVVYELEEYLEDVFTDSNRLGDGPDTANDLLMNTLGAGLVIFILWRILVLRDKKKQK